PRFAGAFLFDDLPCGASRKATMVNGPAVDGTFFRDQWNQKAPTVLRQFGLGSMSLILLHHLLFHLQL
ncbi:MAG: hypothetical protein ACRED3_13590, partial [Bradyrhizobium sp.]